MDLWLSFCLLGCAFSGIDDVRRRPVKISNGVEILNGSANARKILITERNIPYGSHINIARDFNGVGVRANLPSWKISAFG